MSDSIIVRSASDSSTQAAPAAPAEAKPVKDDTSAPAETDVSDEVETLEDSEPSEPENPDDTDDGDGEEDGDETKKEGEGDATARPKPSKRESRIKRLSSKLGEAKTETATARAEAEFWKKKALGTDGAKAETQAEAKPTETETFTGKPKPVIDDFDSPAEFAEALTDWKLAERDAKAAADAESTRIQQQVEQEKNAHLSRVEKFKSENPDYENFVEEFLADHPNYTPSPALNQLIATSEQGPAILMELLKTPQELLRINELSLAGAGLAIGKIAARLEGNREQRPHKIKASSAPNPVSPVGSKSGGVPRTIFNAETQEEFERARMPKK